MDKPRLVATYYTLAGKAFPGEIDVSPHSFQRRAEAASAAGYHGIGVSGHDLKASLERHGRAGMRQILKDCGLDFFEIECLTDWFSDGEARKASDDMRKLWLETASELGTDHFKVVGDIRQTGVSLERMADEFRQLCEEAAPAGVHISLEIFPDANIDDIATGRKLMDLADLSSIPNGGLLIDIWHITRPGIPYSEIEELPVNYIAHVELDDAASEMIGGYFEDTSHRRLLPGEGVFDVPAFLRAIGSTGYDGVYGVEILSDAMRVMEPEEAARKSFDATIAQFRRVPEGV